MPPSDLPVPTLSQQSDRVFVADFGSATVLLEVWADAFAVYAPRAADAPPSTVEGAEHFTALLRDDDGVVSREGMALVTVDGGELAQVAVVDEEGFALAEAALAAFDAHPRSAAWFAAARRSALVVELEDLECAEACAADAARLAIERRTEASARVAAVRARIAELDAAAASV